MNKNMPPVIVPAEPKIVPAQALRPTYDPYSRPASDVTVEEWRILICAIAGRLRIAHGRTRLFPMAQNRPVQIASNDKSYALFIQARTVEVVGAAYIVGSDSNVSVASGQQFLNTFEQILLPKEKLWALTTTPAGATLSVTEVTV